MYATLSYNNNKKKKTGIPIDLLIGRELIIDLEVAVVVDQVAGLAVVRSIHHRPN